MNTTSVTRPSAPPAGGADHPWEAQARCRGMSTGSFFSDDIDDIADAKRVCLTCPVRTNCLDTAVQRGEQFGVWGGHLFVAGRIVLSKRRRGRPPKVPRPQDTLPEVGVPPAYRRLVAAGTPDQLRRPPEVTRDESSRYGG